jgi:hypothetical protein
MASTSEDKLKKAEMEEQKRFKKLCSRGQQFQYLTQPLKDAIKRWKKSKKQAEEEPTSSSSALLWQSFLQSLGVLPKNQPADAYLERQDAISFALRKYFCDQFNHGKDKHGSDPEGEGGEIVPAENVEKKKLKSDGPWPSFGVGFNSGGQTMAPSSGPVRRQELLFKGWV